MDKNIFTQLEFLARNWQIRHLKKIYPNPKGIRIGNGFLWQHPGNKREQILERFRQKLRDYGL